MDKYTIAPPSGSTNNSVGAADRPWHEGHFGSVKLNGGDLGEYLAESTGYGIVSGCEPTISGLTVTVGAGIVHLADGTRKEIAETNITLDAADSTNPRIDLVYINADGVVVKATGTAAADPSPQLMPDNCIGICLVEIAANATTGTVTLKQDTSIIDEYSWNPVFRRTAIPCSNQQDAAYYGGKLFWGVAEAGTLVAYDIATNTTVATMTLDGGAKPHCNTVCFGYKQNNADAYPLIYLTGYNGKDSSNNNLPLGTCFVYKINAGYTTTLVQQINIGFTSDDLWKVGTGTRPTGIGAISYGNFVVDTERNRLLVITCTAQNPVTRIFEFELPATSSATVTLQTTDIIYYWDIPLLSWPQGTDFYAGKIYASHGIEERTSAVDVIDIASKSIISHIDLSDFITEAEGVFLVDDRLFIKGTTKYHEIINYKKISSMGKLPGLITERKSSIVEAINDSVTNGISLKSFTNGPVGKGAKFLPITAYADANEDLFNPIKDAIESASFNGETRMYFFVGLVSSHNGTGFSKVEGWYKSDINSMCFTKCAYWRDDEKRIYEYDNGQLTAVRNENSFTSLTNCKTSFYAAGPNKVLTITAEVWTILLVSGNYGVDGILRQIIIGNNSASISAYDNITAASISVSAEGNNTYKITIGESVICSITSNKRITVTNVA